MAVARNKKLAMVAAATILTVAGVSYVAGSQVMLNVAEKSYGELIDRINKVDGVEVIESEAGFGFLNAKGQLVIAQTMEHWRSGDATPKILAHIQWKGSPSLKGFSIDGAINHTLDVPKGIPSAKRSQLEKGLGVDQWGELNVSAIVSNATKIIVTNPTGKPFYITPFLMGDAYAVASGQTTIEVTKNYSDFDFEVRSKEGYLTAFNQKNLLNKKFSLSNSNIAEHTKLDGYNAKLSVSNGRVNAAKINALNAYYTIGNEEISAKGTNFYFEDTESVKNNPKLSYGIGLSIDDINYNGNSYGESNLKAKISELNSDSFYFIAKKLPMIVKGTEEGKMYDRGGKHHREMLHNIQNLLEGSPRIDIDKLSLSAKVNGISINLDTQGYIAFNAEGLPRNLMLRSEDRLKNYELIKHLELDLQAKLPVDLIRIAGVPSTAINPDRQSIQVKNSAILFNGVKVKNL